MVGESGLMSVTVTVPPPVARSARWNACTSATRLEPAVMRTLSDTSALWKAELKALVRHGFALRDGTREPFADDRVEACRRHAVRRSQRDEIGSGNGRASGKMTCGAQRTSARIDISSL